jgi:hypothetical protein
MTLIIVFLACSGAGPAVVCIRAPERADRVAPRRGRERAGLVHEDYPLLGVVVHGHVHIPADHHNRPWRQSSLIGRAPCVLQREEFVGTHEIEHGRLPFL